MVNPPAIPTKERRGMKKGEEQKREEDEQATREHNGVRG
jgi:hypothetical protein